MFSIKMFSMASIFAVLFALGNTPNSAKTTHKTIAKSNSELTENGDKAKVKRLNDGSYLFGGGEMEQSDLEQLIGLYNEVGMGDQFYLETYENGEKTQSYGNAEYKNVSIEKLQQGGLVASNWILDKTVYKEAVDQHLIVWDKPSSKIKGQVDAVLEKYVGGMDREATLKVQKLESGGYHFTGGQMDEGDLHTLMELYQEAGMGEQFYVETFRKGEKVNEFGQPEYRDVTIERLRRNGEIASNWILDKTVYKEAVNQHLITWNKAPESIRGQVEEILGKYMVD